MEPLADFFSRKEGQPPLKTRVLVTPQAAKEIDKLKDAHSLLTKMEKCAENGFGNYRCPPLHKEGDGIVAVGIPDSKDRIAGYYAGPNASVFIVCGAYTKKGDRGPQGDGVVARCVADRKARKNAQ